MNSTVNDRNRGKSHSLEETSASSSWDVHCYLLFGLAGLHLVLLTLVYFVPVLIGGREATFSTWARKLHGSLNSAQYDLIAIFWAISGGKWHIRTVLALSASFILCVAHVAVALLLTNSDSSLVSTGRDLFLNTVHVFIGDMLVIAILIELLRPIFGSLTRKQPQGRELISIYSILRTTAMSALAVALLKSFGELSQGIEVIPWLCKRWSLQTACALSCIWLAFATRHNWLGIVGLLMTMSLDVTFAHPNLVRNGQAGYVLFLLAEATWIFSTLLVIRYFGFRLRNHESHNRAF